MASLLRDQGGPYADLVNRFEAHENGRCCLADRVRLMVQSERHRQGLPVNKVKAAALGQSVGSPGT